MDMYIVDIKSIKYILCFFNLLYVDLDVIVKYK